MNSHVVHKSCTHVYSRPPPWGLRSAHCTSSTHACMCTAARVLRFLFDTYKATYMQDADLRVKRDFDSIAQTGFLLPIKTNTDPKTYADLETPSRLPFQAVPKIWSEELLGGVVVFARAVKTADPELVFLAVGIRAGGSDVDAILTASCVSALIDGSLI